MDKKRLAINMSAQLLVFVINLGISFVLTGVIDSSIDDGYGFVKTANDIVIWAQIVVSALNTMASRFITIQLHKKDHEGANEYFSSVFYANLMMAGIFLLPAVCVVLFLNQLFQVPGEILRDVQLLWSFVFLNFFVSIITSVFGVTTYSLNRLELTSFATIVSELARVSILFITYRFFPAYLWYVGLGSVAATGIVAAANFGYTRRLLPQVRIRKSFFRWKKVWELISLGAWNSVTRLGQVLLDGLDTVIANVLIDAAAMNSLAIAKQIPTMLSSLMGTVVGVFTPSITIAYAREDRQELLDVIQSSNRIMIFMMSIPIAFVVAYGRVFFSLWMSWRQDQELLYRLAVLSMAVLFVSASIQVLYHVFIITKKVRVNSLVMVGSGALTTAIVFVLLKTTNLGLYAIAGVSTVIGLVRNLTFTPIYAARCLQLKWNYFYRDIAMGLFSIVCIWALGVISQLLFPIDSWTRLFLVGCGTGVVALGVNFWIVLRKGEREMIFRKLKEKLGGGAGGAHE
ncbi:MAG: MATE family efflux transporter [Lachnospiraceae bacterium]|nr:MATE family efflux transporter [Lachnospiraceae bacterium]